MKKPPNQKVCLYLAQMYWDIPRRTEEQTRLSWDYLICWAFYEMYVEGYFE
jgi:hypothetical protein